MTSTCRRRVLLQTIIREIFEALHSRNLQSDWCFHTNFDLLGLQSWPQWQYWYYSFQKEFIPVWFNLIKFKLCIVVHTQTEDHTNIVFHHFVLCWREITDGCLDDKQKQNKQKKGYTLLFKWELKLSTMIGSTVICLYIFILVLATWTDFFKVT